MLLPSDIPVAQIKACMQRYRAIMRHTMLHIWTPTHKMKVSNWHPIYSPLFENLPSYVHRVRCEVVWIILNLKTKLTKGIDI